MKLKARAGIFVIARNLVMGTPEQVIKVPFKTNNSFILILRDYDVDDGFISISN